jgi:hypothetical protein
MAASNAKKKNYTEDKLNKKLELGEASIAKYMADLDEFDKTDNLTAEQAELKDFTQDKLNQLRKWQDKFKALHKELKDKQAIDPEVTQISLTDPDARCLVVNNSGHAEVAFNIVTAVDDKHSLIANYFTENVKDTNLLAESAIAVKAEFDNNFHPDLHKTTNDNEGVDLSSKLDHNKPLIALADKGFHTASELKECADNNIITYVAFPKPAYSGKDKEFTIANFSYKQDEDYYTCPNNQQLTTNGIKYDKKNRRGVVVTQYKRYNMSPKTCAECPFAAKCLSKTAIKNRVSRQLERADCQDAVENNRKRIETAAGRKQYLRRQAIVEHPFGVLKRQWGTYFTLLRGIEKVNAEFAIVCACYNIRRSVSILGVKDLINKLKNAKNNQNLIKTYFFKPILGLLNILTISFEPKYKVA